LHHVGGLFLIAADRWRGNEAGEQLHGVVDIVLVSHVAEIEMVM